MIELARWRKGKDFRSLLESFEPHIPLEHASVLQRPSFAEKLQVLSEGLLGELATLLMKAAVLAIRNKTEKIDEEILEKLNFKPPSIRRATAREVVGR
jgi:hypothetical protein